MRRQRTKGVLHECRSCGHAWYPRGGTISRRCPGCSLENPPAVHKLAVEMLHDAIRKGKLPNKVWFGEATAEDRKREFVQLKPGRTGDVTVERRKPSFLSTLFGR